MILTLVLLTLILAAVVYIIMPGVIDSVEKLAENIGGYISRADDNLDDYIERHLTEGSFMSKVYASIKSAWGVDENHTLFSKIVEKASDWIIDLFSEKTLQRIFSLGSSLIEALINIVLAIFFMIYLLYSKERQAARIRKFTTAYFKKERVDRFYRMAYMTDERVGRFLRTRVAESIIVGLVSFLVYVIIGLPYAPLLALISGVTNIIPYFGPFIGAVPDGLLVLIAAPEKLLAFLISVLIIQQIDGNVLAPIMQSNSMKIDSFWVLAGLTIMGGVFGLPGLILGVPVFAVIYILIREKTEARLKKKGLSTRTGDYVVMHHERKKNHPKPPIVKLIDRIKKKKTDKASTPEEETASLSAEDAKTETNDADVIDDGKQKVKKTARRIKNKIFRKK